MFPVESARPEELEPALRLIFRQFSPEGCDGRVRRALALIDEGEIPRDGILTVRRAGRLLGAMVCVPLAGASGLVWPPQAVEGDGRVEDSLVRAALVWLRARGAHLVEALLLPAEQGFAAPLLRNGFRCITRLSYLRRPVSDNDAVGGEDDPPGPRLTCEPYGEATRAAFHETLLRSYEQTLDCPELNGVRSVEEIITGHKAQGVYDPARWWLAREHGRPVAVLILTEMAEWASWDVAYVGVVPEARGRGVGRALLARAFRTAAKARAGRITLAVDERNEPARRLYDRLGFEPFDERDVYLALFS
jgi:ribosomal protein S18 acetylase RimI-like enzyme